MEFLIQNVAGSITSICPKSGGGCDSDLPCDDCYCLCTANYCAIDCVGYVCTLLGCHPGGRSPIN